ncbi:MAG: hypothetical protein ACRBN8_16390 [Nannocystales bacterium]
MQVAGHRPALALEVELGGEHMDTDAVPSRAQTAQAIEARDRTLEELERSYGPTYAKKLYG